MTVSVTMLQTRRGEDGSLWTVAGSPYVASVEFARQLITGNYATGTLPDPMQSYPVNQLVATAAEIAVMDGEPGVLYVERDGAQRMFRWIGGAMLEIGAGGSGYLGAGNQAAMLAESGAAIGGMFTRTDTSPYTTWQLDALPASTLANWREVGDVATTQRVAFSGAGTDVLVWIGEGTVMSVVLTAGAAGSIVMKDQLTAGTGPTIATLTTTTTPETFTSPFNSGAGRGIYGGLTLTITGANTGYVVMKGA